jgi:hypothetical protein
VKRLVALALIVAAAGILFVPDAVRGWRNGRGIAWDVPEGEDVRFAEAGMAVTRTDDTKTLVGRDLKTGAERWRLPLPKRPDSGQQLRIQRVGRTILVSAGTLQAVDLDSGKVRWQAPASEILIPVIASPDLVAMTRCDGECTAEVRSVRDGSVRWRAPVFNGAVFLGAPTVDESLQARDALWPASVVIVRPPPEGDRYEARSLTTGRVVARGVADREAVGVVGNLFIRAVGEGVVSAVDVSTGREAWTRPADGLIPMRAEHGRLRWLGMPDGGLILSPRLANLPYVQSGERLRLLDPRTGKLTERRIGLSYRSVEVFAGEGPPITAETATRGVAPRVPVLASTDTTPRFAVDGRVFRPKDAKRSSLAATSRQVVWLDSGALEVRDRRTGERVERYVADELRARAVGERIVIEDGDANGVGDREYVVDVG